MRGHDVVARYGGEEFVLVYPELTVKKAMEVIERIRLALEKAIEAAHALWASMRTLLRPRHATLASAFVGLLERRLLGRVRERERRYGCLAAVRQ